MRLGLLRCSRDYGTSYTVQSAFVDYPVIMPVQNAFSPKFSLQVSYMLAALGECGVSVQSTRTPAAQTPQTPQEPYFDGPASWDEVDTEELERITVNILRSVVPSTENLEVGARLAMQVGSDAQRLT